MGRDQFSGTDPDQDPEQFIQLIERKYRFSHGDTPGAADAGALADYNFRRKSYFATLLRGPAAEWLKPPSRTQTLGTKSKLDSLHDFQMEDTNLDTEWKLSTFKDEMEKI